MIMQPQLYYYHTSQAMPTNDDGESILAYGAETNGWIRITLEEFTTYAGRYSHWMRLPEVPNPSHQPAPVEIIYS